MIPDITIYDNQRSGTYKTCQAWAVLAGGPAPVPTDTIWEINLKIAENIIMLANSGGFAPGAGTVKSFSATGLAALFGVDVATPDTTPALSFTPVSPPPNTVLAGPASGGPGPYSFRALTADDLPPLAGGVASVSATAPVASTGGANPVISMPKADGATDGYLSSADWVAFNGKQPAGAYLTDVAADAPLTGDGTAGSHLSIPQASGSVDGYLDSADWTAFAAKQAAGNYITALTGDVTASGPGSAVATLANTTVTPGSYMNANIDVDSKGRITAAISIPELMLFKASGLAVGTSGSPTDIGSIALPAWLTRYVVSLAGTGRASIYAVAETAAGTLSGASFDIRTASGGGGDLLGTIAGPAAVNYLTLSSSGAQTTPVPMSPTIYIRQTSDSANAGTVSFYVTLTPLL